MKSIIGAAVGAILALGVFPWAYELWYDDVRHRLGNGQSGFVELYIILAVPGLVLALGLLLVFVWGRPSRWAGVIGLAVGAATVAIVWYLLGYIHDWTDTLQSALQLAAGLALGYLSAMIVGHSGRERRQGSPRPSRRVRASSLSDSGDACSPGGRSENSLGAR